MLINPWHISEMEQHSLSYLFIHLLFFSPHFESTCWQQQNNIKENRWILQVCLEFRFLQKYISHLPPPPHNHCTNDIRKKFTHIRGCEHIHHFHCKCLWMREHNPGLCTITDKPPWNADMSTIHTHLHDNQRPEPSIVIHHPDISPHFTEI